jgi:hypothetical protein
VILCDAIQCCDAVRGMHRESLRAGSIGPIFRGDVVGKRSAGGDSLIRKLA